MPVDKSLLEEITNKSEEERTPVEKALLELSVAEQEQSSSNTDSDIDWEKAFNHPRFKELVSKRKEAEDKLIRIEAERKAKEIETLAKNNEFKTLYETTQKELDDVRKQAEIATQYEETLKKVLETELETLHPDAKKLVPSSLSVSQQLEYISANRALLQKQKAEDIGSGRRNLGSGKKSAELSQEQLEFARRFNMSPDEYAKFANMETNENPNSWHQTFSLDKEDKK